MQPVRSAVTAVVGLSHMYRRQRASSEKVCRAYQVIIADGSSSGRYSRGTRVAINPCFLQQSALLARVRGSFRRASRSFWSRRASSTKSTTRTWCCTHFTSPTRSSTCRSRLPSGSATGQTRCAAYGPRLALCVSPLAHCALLWATEERNP